MRVPAIEATHWMATAPDVVADAEWRALGLG
jgi:hypothetical protein